MNSLKIAIAAAVLSLTVQTSHAETTAYDEVRTYRVQYQDLNLDKSEDLRQLQARIERAAEKVCNTPVSRDLKMNARFRACVAESVGRAVATFDDPRLTAYVQSQAEPVRTAAVRK